MNTVITQILILIALVPTASAQETRVEEITRQQSEKAAAVQPHRPSKAERSFLSVEQELIDTPSGLYPLLGSVYAGVGLAVGGRYRQYYGDRTFWDVKGLISIRNYKFAEFATSTPGHL